MRRNYNTNKEGRGFSEKTVQQVWEKAARISHEASGKVRLDRAFESILLCPWAFRTRQASSFHLN